MNLLLAAALLLSSTPSQAFQPIHPMKSAQFKSTALHADMTTAAQEASPPSQEPYTTTTSVLPDMAAYSNGYKTVFNEISCSLMEPSAGTLPLDLVGTYYKCGPAMFSA